MRQTNPKPLVAVAVVALTMVAACAPSSAKPGGTPTSGSPSPSVVSSPTAIAGTVASPSPEGPLTVEDVTVNIGQVSENPLWYFGSGHWLYADDLNDTIVYDGKVVVHGDPVTAALSQNGLHYAYTLANSLLIYVDGHARDVGTYIPEVFAVSDDGATVLYSDTAGKDGAGTIYRSGVAILTRPDGIGEAVGSADAMHYTAVVFGTPETLVHDGQTVAVSGITSMSAPMLSPDGIHYGVSSGADTSVDDVAILPAGDSGRLDEITDTGDWVALDDTQGSVPDVDGVVKGPPAEVAVITADGHQIAIDTTANTVLVNGVDVGPAPHNVWLEIEGNTLYVYDIVTV
jgi:hypothetical protein